MMNSDLKSHGYMGDGSRIENYLQRTLGESNS